MITGRPIRFLLSVMGGWTMIRLTMLLPVSEPVAIGPRFMEARGSSPDSPGIRRLVAALSQRMNARLHRPSASPAPASFAALPPAPATATEGGSGGGWATRVADDMLVAQLGFVHSPRNRSPLARFAPGMGLSPSEAGLPRTPSPAAPPDASAQDRWSGAAWLLWRQEDGAEMLARDGRLGGSQAGLRMDYAIAPGSSLHPTLYGRVSSALEAPAAAEAAAGVAIRPHLPLPLTLAVERRQALSRGGRSDFAALASGGIPEIALGRWRLDGYAQAGVVGGDAFADGRLTVERTVSTATEMAVGGALWGGAQPGLARLDIGPEASLRLRVGGARMRVGAEWRERVAGDATPRSGPSLSVGSDF